MWDDIKNYLRLRSESIEKYLFYSDDLGHIKAFIKNCNGEFHVYIIYDEYEEKVYRIYTPSFSFKPNALQIENLLSYTY